MQDRKDLQLNRDITQRITDFQRRVPIVADKALVDLVNGIQVTGEIIRFRKRLSVIGQLVESVSGKGAQSDLLVYANLNLGQQSLAQWILELTDSLSISQLALRRTQESLFKALNAIRVHENRLRNQSSQSLALVRQIEELSSRVNSRLNEFDERLQSLEFRVRAGEDFDRKVSSWIAGQTYQNLPWAVQIAFLAREVFSSYVTVYEFRSGETKHFRELLLQRMLVESTTIPATWFNLADLLDQTWNEMLSPDRHLVADLLEMRSWPLMRVLDAPLLFAMATTFEIASLPQELLPPSPAKCAIEICRMRISHSIANTTDKEAFIRDVIAEVAEDCLRVMRDTTS
jgi:hypothetical protein